MRREIGRGPKGGRRLASHSDNDGQREQHQRDRSKHILTEGHTEGEAEGCGQTP